MSKGIEDYNNTNVDVVGSAKVAVQYGAQNVSNLPITIGIDLDKLY